MAFDEKIITVLLQGDSGDGIQLLGQVLSRDIAQSGVFIKTEPNYPAEIRAPQGTQAGISGFRVSLSEEAHFAIEKKQDVLVSLNPAGLAQALTYLKPGGLLLVNSDQFKEKDFNKARLSLDFITEAQKKNQFQILEVPITGLTLKSLENFSLPHSSLKQCKNMFVLGLLLYLFERDYAASKEWLEEKLKDKSQQLEANLVALKAGYHYLEIQEFQLGKVQLGTHKQAPGYYRQINGNQALALGAAAFAAKTKKELVFSGYPITPASTLLHELKRLKQVKVIQAEDEMAACGIALGACYGGALGLTCTSGPGLDLKMEMIGLAVMSEMPLVIIDVQRAGPATGLPTKTEQSDLLQAIHGRHGESPCIVLAALSAVDCFQKIQDAFTLALQHSVPVILLSDASIANSIEVWQIPENINMPQLPSLATKVFERTEKGRLPFQLGDPKVIQTLGGLEKNVQSGQVSYAPADHLEMSQLRKDKLTHLDYHGYQYQGNQQAEVLLVSWGSVLTVAEAVYTSLIKQGYSVALLNLELLHPLPVEIKQFFTQKNFVLELNDGQLSSILKATDIDDLISINQISGEAFEKEYLLQRIQQHLEQEEIAHGEK